MSWRRGNRLPIVPEGQATGRTAEIYREIKTALGIEHVPSPFLSCAAYPKFLELLWNSLRPCVGSTELLQLATRLQAETYTRVHNYFVVPSIANVSANPELTALLDLIAYTDPIMLILLAAQQQALESPTGFTGSPHPAPRPAFAARMRTVEYTTAPASIRKIFDDMRRAHGMSLVHSSNCALAVFPDFLARYWAALRAPVYSPIFGGVQVAVRDDAYALAASLPVIVDLEYARLAEAGLTASEIGAVTRVTEQLVYSATGALIDVTFARIAIEGGNFQRPPLAISTEVSDESKPAA